MCREESGGAVKIFERAPILDRVVRALLLLCEGELGLFSARDLARAPRAGKDGTLVPGVEVTLDEHQVITL